jgi:NADH-quinone oxidoreductase subunit J
MEAAPLVFWLLAVVAVGGAVGVVTMRQPVHSALFLLVTFMAVAGLFVFNHAEFLAAVQVLVYAGGVMVLFLFTVMLVNLRRTAHEPYVNRLAGAAVLVGLLLFSVVGGVLVTEAKRLPSVSNSADPARLATTHVVLPGGTSDVKGNSEAVAWGLYRDYLLPFEVASVFLLVAMIGAVVLGKRTTERFD